jgi:hypothetical protein
MTGFLRVKASKGPDAEFYASEAWVAKHPDAYKVLDKTPVEKPPAVIKTTAKPSGSSSKSVGNTPKKEES